MPPSFAQVEASMDAAERAQQAKHAVKAAISEMVEAREATAVAHGFVHAFSNLAQQVKEGSRVSIIISATLFAVLFLGAAIATCTWQQSRNKSAKRSLDKRLLKPLTRDQLRTTETSETSATPRILVDVNHGSAVHLLARISDATPLNKRIQMHPWAAPPETLGCLAIAHLAAIAAKPSGADEIRVKGGVQLLVDQLSSTLDRRHFALVALGFLSADGDCAEIMLEQNLPDRLAHLLVFQEAGPERTVEQVPPSVALNLDRWRRAAAALVLHNLFVWSRPAMRAFVKAHGLRGFADLVQCPPDVVATTEASFDLTLVAQLHAIINLLDVVGEETVDEVTRSKSLIGSLTEVFLSRRTQVSGREIFRARPLAEHSDPQLAADLAAQDPRLARRLEQLTKLTPPEVAYHAAALLHDINQAGNTAH